MNSQNIDDIPATDPQLSEDEGLTADLQEIPGGDDINENSAEVEDPVPGDEDDEDVEEGEEEVPAAAV